MATEKRIMNALMAAGTLLSLPLAGAAETAAAPPPAVSAPVLWQRR